jgi:hypothetical protein
MAPEIIGLVEEVVTVTEDSNGRLSLFGSAEARGALHLKLPKQDISEGTRVIGSHDGHG